ncbi:MAG: hypothetical protein IJ466_02930 [Clostridia bacterium]|nr:hypothetical protein [Clostridia bacterium]
MVGILLLCAFLVCGVAVADALFSRKSGFVRLWLGLCTGLMMMMWLPVPFAYLMDFTLAAQVLALACAAAIAAVLSWRCGRFRAWKNPKLLPGAGQRFLGDMPGWIPLALVVPMTVLTGYLLFTHTLQVQDGALHVGQSTYGDLCLHLGIATGMRNASFPPDYTILPGALLGYPFLADSMVTTMLLGGSGLAFSFVLTGTLMAALVFTGFVIFAWELTHRRAAVVLAFVFMFFNGGLGFLYTLDGVAKDSTMLQNVFTGFYQTPTNMPDLNLRWVNVVCDMMVPQRTLLCGWMLLLPALYMLVNAVKEEKKGYFIFLGIWAGLMPMAHTHSFFGLGLMSIGVMAHRLLRSGDRKKTFLCFLTYGLIAVALAAPQLLTWTFPQTIGGASSSGSLSLRFNWVNNQGNGELIDGYFWFWVKNVGPIYLLMVPAALSAKKGSLLRSLSIGALVIYTVAELIQFQPNPYDNNKLFYVAYMLMMPVLALFLLRLWERLRGIPGRTMLACLLIGANTLSAGLSMAREVVSDYQLFSASEVEAAEYIEENLPEKAVLLTGDQHNNAVAALTGRYIVCGTGSYLYYHGIDYSAQRDAMQRMLAAPGENTALFDQYNVDYIYISDYERYNFGADEEWFEEYCYKVFDNGSVKIYAYDEEDFAAASAQIVALD